MGDSTVSGGNHYQTMASAALICGVLGIVGAWIPLVKYFTGLLTIAAVVFGAISMRKLPVGQKGHGLAMAGFVIGIVSVICAIIGIAL